MYPNVNGSCICKGVPRIDLNEQFGHYELVEYVVHDPLRQEWFPRLHQIYQWIAITGIPRTERK